MSIEERTSGHVTVLDVSGRMTIETVGDMPLLARVRRLLQGGRTHVVLNLAWKTDVITAAEERAQNAQLRSRLCTGDRRRNHAAGDRICDSCCRLEPIWGRTRS
jgi:hypothetical protein